MLNGKAADVSTVVRNGDVISHTLHRHEPPVTATPIGIVHENDDFLVINKPAGVPVHPTGRYKFNSLVEIIRAHRGAGFNALPCHRLDRLTSGIMFLGKHKQAADDLGQQIKSRSIDKEYIARVAGRFPDGDVVCEKPILQISPKLGLNRVRAHGKEARTVFQRLAYYPPKEHAQRSCEGVHGIDERVAWKRFQGYSIVRCVPLTGRTHQLRVHLQYLGHPISNDPIYCNRRVFGPTLGAAASDSEADDDIVTHLSRMGKEEAADAIAYHEEMVDEYNKRRAEKMTGDVCLVCRTPLYSDPGVHELGIYLHARRYACHDGRWGYETPLPDWARPPPGPEGAAVDSPPLCLDEQPDSDPAGQVPAQTHQRG